MSKNGYRLFKNYDPYITSNFGYRIHPITKVKTFHSGVDYGTNDKKIPCYALEDGVVLGVGFAKANGNYVYVNFPRLKKTAIYQHLDSIKVQKGEKVNKETIIGYTGATGEVTGIHLHFGIFKESDFAKSWFERSWEDFEKYDYPELIKIIGTPVTRNKDNSQIEVKINDLYARTSPNGDILGYIKPGFYNILDSKENNNYTWYQIATDLWIAYKAEYANLYLLERKENDIEEKPLDTKPSTDMLQETSPKESEVESSTAKVSFWQRIIDFLKKIFKKLGIL